MEIEGSLSLIVYVTSIFGVNCFWVSVFFQVDAYGGHMGEEGKWGICGEDCPVAAESEGGSQYTLSHVTTAGPHCREDPLRATRADQTIHSGGGHSRHPGQRQAALHTGSQGEML